MNFLLNFLPGKKTIVTGGFLVGVGLAQAVGLEVPEFSPDAGTNITNGLGLIFLRMGIGKGV